MQPSDPPLTHRGPTLALHNIARAFGAVIAVDNVSQNVAAGAFIALVGASGSGKSTLLKTINRLIPVDSGSVHINGVDAASQEVHHLRRSIGYVFQNIGLFPHMTVAQNIAISPRLGPGPNLAAPDIAELLALVELPAAFANRMPDQLSGGQKQRVGVARALAAKPGLMLMDEPFGALDPVTRQSLGNSYHGLHDRLGLTTIMVTHDMAEALLLADTIWVMAQGRIVATGSAAEMLAGTCGPEAEQLVAVPRQQAEALLAKRGTA